MLMALPCLFDGGTTTGASSGVAGGSGDAVTIFISAFAAAGAEKDWYSA